MNRRYVSFLDLMCCGFGGALLMFLIVVSTQSRQEPSQPMLLIRCRANLGDNSAARSGAELGLQYRRAGQTPWTRPNGPQDANGLVSGGKSRAWYFFPKASDGSGADAVFICNHPRAGRWEVRAYVASTAALESLGNRPPVSGGPAPSDREAIPVVLEVLGAASAVRHEATLMGVADFTPPVVFEIPQQTP